MTLSLNFLDRWESAIFNKHSNGNHIPVSTFTGKLVLWAACILAVTVVILNFTSYDQSASNTAVGIIFGGALLIMVWKVSKNFRVFASVKTKIGYAAYMLALFVVSSAIFIILAFVAVFIIMVALALWVVWLFFISDKSSKGKKTGNWGMAQGCPYRNGAYCTFTGHNHGCNLLNGGEHCQHGQR